MKKLIRLQQPPELEAMQSPLMQRLKSTSKGTAFEILAIDPGTSHMGIAHLKWESTASGKTCMCSLIELQTIAGASHLPNGCQDTAALLLSSFPMCRYVIIEKPSDRIYGRKANPYIHRSFWQVIHLLQAFQGNRPWCDTVDAFTWQAVPRGRGKGRLQQVADDKMKRPWFDHHFQSWQASSNNHERDAALLGYWWCHVLHHNEKPQWNTGYGA